MKITKNGDLKFIYNDELQNLFDEGQATIRRASNVEPTPDNKWQADFSPLGINLILGPFNTRQEALDAEVKWLEENGLPEHA